MITTQIYLIGAANTSFYLLQVKEIHCNAYTVSIDRVNTV